MTKNHLLILATLLLAGIVLGLILISIPMPVTAPSQLPPTPISTSVPASSLQSDTQYTANLLTSAGKISILLDTKNTPLTSANFVTLSKKGFYNGTIFHRVIKGFMIQGGDPNGDGTGGPGYKFADEPFTGSYTKGTVAMANSGPNTNGSQFFIMHKDNPLPPNYVIFGHVITGLEVVDKIATASVSAGSMGEMSKPVDPVKITSVDIQTSN
jgi:cyclophilin family peptidyl-prolyl cis-trans isomerase